MEITHAEQNKAMNDSSFYAVPHIIAEEDFEFFSPNHTNLENKWLNFNVVRVIERLEKEIEEACNMEVHVVAARSSDMKQISICFVEGQSEEEIIKRVEIGDMWLMHVYNIKDIDYKGITKMPESFYADVIKQYKQTSMGNTPIANIVPEDRIYA